MKNVFISHVHEDDEGLARLKNLLATRGYVIRDGSINSEKPNRATSEDYIKASILRPRITWASTLIVYVSHETRNSEWVNWEIEEAQRQGKTVVGVWAHGASEADAPDALEACADAVHTGWNAEAIINAIEGRDTGWEKPDGTTRDPRSIARVRCQ